jgi:hypothetical protein
MKVKLWVHWTLHHWTLFKIIILLEIWNKVHFLKKLSKVFATRRIVRKHDAMTASRQLYGTANTSRDAYHESTGLLDSVAQPLFVLLVFIKQIHKWYGSQPWCFMSQFGLARTVNHLAPLLVPLCWGNWVFVASFTLAFCFIPLCSFSPCQVQVMGAAL